MQLIPPIFHFAWFGSPLPPLYHCFIKTWMDRHPSWKVCMWTDTNLPPLRHRALFDEAQHPVYKSEVLRLEVVHQMGGVWVDTDFECFKRIDPLLDNVSAFAAWQFPDRGNPAAINNAIFGATKGHPMLRELLDMLPKVWRPDCMSLGPWFFTPAAKKHGIRVFDAELFYPFRSHEKHRAKETFPRAYAAHHWAASWAAHHHKARRLPGPEWPKS